MMVYNKDPQIPTEISQENHEALVMMLTLMLTMLYDVIIINHYSAKARVISLNS